MFETHVDPQAVQAAESAAAGGDGTFPPLPKGRYQAFIEKIEGVDQFAKSGANADPTKRVVRIRFKVHPQSPNGANRVFFGRIPLFSRFAPTEKNPEGAPARDFWDFWERAIGVPREQIVSGQPMPSDITGRQITITLSAPIAPDNYNPLGSNEISFYDAAGDLNATPLGAATAPWLDANGNLIQGFGNAAQVGQPAAPAAAPANPWGGQPAPNQPPAQAFTQPPAPPAPPAPVQAAPAPAPAAPPAQSESPWGGYTHPEQPAFPGQVTAPLAQPAQPVAPQQAAPQPPAQAAPPAPAAPQAPAAPVAPQMPAAPTPPPGVQSSDAALNAALQQGGAV